MKATLAKIISVLTFTTPQVQFHMVFARKSNTAMRASNLHTASFALWVCLSAVTLLFTQVAVAQAPGGDAAERQRIAGTWEGWLVEGDGSQPSQRRQKINELVINASQISAKDGRNISMGTGGYRLGTAGNLRSIDAQGTGGPTQGKAYLGIYQLQGDTLKWCSGNDKAKTRPAEFKTNTGNGHFLMILTRKK